MECFEVNILTIELQIILECNVYLLPNQINADFSVPVPK